MEATFRAFLALQGNGIQDLCYLFYRISRSAMNTNSGIVTSDAIVVKA